MLIVLRRSHLPAQSGAVALHSSIGRTQDSKAAYILYTWTILLIGVPTLQLRSREWAEGPARLQDSVGLVLRNGP